MVRTALRLQAIAWLSCLTAAPAVIAAEPEVQVELSQKEIYEGQSVVYSVRVTNAEKPSAPVLELPDFEIASLGEQSLDSQQVYVINGRRTEIIQRGRQYNYRLTPRKTGALAIAAPTVKADGRVVAGKSLSLRVVPAAEQDLVAISLRADRQSLYPTQSVTVTVSVTVKELPEPHSEVDPMSVQEGSPPVLTIPWADDDKLPDGLVPVKGRQQWLRGMLGEHGFSINELGDDSPFSFFERRRLTFLSATRKVKRKGKEGKLTGYRQYDFPRTFTGRKPGEYLLGPVTVEGLFAAEVQGRRLSGKRAYAAAKPLVITVRDAPLENRPASYAGVIGRMSAEGQLTPREAKVGDPLTLTLTLSGPGVSSAAPPDLSRVPGLAERFKVYEATSKTEKDTARFTYSLRGLAEGEQTLPPVELAWFDPDAEKYVTVRTAPITVKIRKADRLSDDQIVATPRSPARTDSELLSRQEGLFANVNELAAFRDQSVRPMRWLLALCSLAGAYVFSSATIVWLRRRAADPAMVRRRQAAGRARMRLREAREASPQELADAVQSVVAGLVADTLNVPEAGLTPKDICGGLEDSGVPADLVSRTRRVLDRCDAARYGAASDGAGELLAETEDLLEQLVAALRSRKGAG